MALFGKFWDRIAPASSAGRGDGTPSEQIDNHVARQIRAGEPGLAIAIVKSGAIVHAAGYGLADIRANKAVATNTIFHLASCGKQFTGLGILMLSEAGKLGLDDPVSRHVQGLRFDPKVTIRRLLQHTSGIRDLYDEEGMEAVLSRCERPDNADIISTYVDLGCPMASDGLKPGDEFCYSNSGYDLLGTVIERASGQSYHDFFQARVFDPLGMKDTFSAPDARLNDARVARSYARDGRSFTECGGSEYDNVVGSGSFYTTVNDMCVYDQALATNALVSAAGMREAMTSGRTNDGKPTNYGFGWFFGDDEGRRYADHEGKWIGYHSYIARYLDQPFSMFILSNRPDIKLADVANLVSALYR